MTALRCTAKLLKAMKARPVANPAQATNKLGEWTANLIRVGRIQLVLAVSEPTRLHCHRCSALRHDSIPPAAQRLQDAVVHRCTSRSCGRRSRGDGAYRDCRHQFQICARYTQSIHVSNRMRYSLRRRTLRSRTDAAARRYDCVEAERHRTSGRSRARGVRSSPDRPARGIATRRRFALRYRWRVACLPSSTCIRTLCTRRLSPSVSH